MSLAISSLSSLLSSISNLTTQKGNLGLLTEQLQTGRKSNNLSDYSVNDARQMLDLSSNITRRQGFQTVATVVDSRLQIYDQVLTGMESIATQGISSAMLSANRGTDANNTLAASQIQGYLTQIESDLNQKLGDRFLFAGSRYATSPVKSLTTLPVPPTEVAPYVMTDPLIPQYDSEYTAPGDTSAASYVKDSVAVDTTQTMTYGISSNQTGFQQLIMGFRLAYAATQDPGPPYANYANDMATAKDLLSKGLAAIQAYHTTVSSQSASLQDTKTLHANIINILTSQVQDIRSVDATETSAKITALKTQLEASYSATGIILSLNLSKYL